MNTEIIKKLLHVEGHKVESDRTLNGYTKKELIETIRYLEQNYGVCLYFYERTVLMNQELSERYSLKEFTDIYRKVDSRMKKAWGRL